MHTSIRPEMSCDTRILTLPLQTEVSKIILSIRACVSERDPLTGYEFTLLCPKAPALKGQPRCSLDIAQGSVAVRSFALKIPLTPPLGRIHTAQSPSCVSVLGQPVTESRFLYTLARKQPSDRLTGSQRDLTLSVAFPHANEIAPTFANVLAVL